MNTAALLAAAVLAAGAAPEPLELVVQQGHRLSLNRIAFSADDRLLLTTSGDATVVRDAASGRQLSRWPGDTPWLPGRPQYPGETPFVNEGALPIDPETIFDGGVFRALRDGRTLAEVQAMTPSTDGRHVHGLDGVWDVATRRQVASGLGAVCGGALVLDVVPRGGTLLALVRCAGGGGGGGTHSLRVVDASTRAEVLRADGTLGLGWLSRDGGTLVWWAADRALRARELAGGAERRGPVVDAGLHSARTTRDGALALALLFVDRAGVRLEARRYDLATLAERSAVRLLSPGERRLERVALSHSGHELALSFQGDGTLHLYSTLTGALLREERGVRGVLTRLEFLADGRLRAMPRTLGDGSGAAWLVEPALGRVDGWVRDTVERSDDGTVCAQLERTDTHDVLRVWELATGARLYERVIPRAYESTHRVWLSPHGRYVAFDTVAGSRSSEIHTLSFVAELGTGRVVWERAWKGEAGPYASVKEARFDASDSFVTLSLDLRRASALEEYWLVALRPGGAAPRALGEGASLSSDGRFLYHRSPAPDGRGSTVEAEELATGARTPYAGDFWWSIAGPGGVALAGTDRPLAFVDARTGAVASRHTLRWAPMFVAGSVPAGAPRFLLDAVDGSGDSTRTERAFVDLERRTVRSLTVTPEKRGKGACSGASLRADGARAAFVTEAAGAGWRVQVFDTATGKRLESYGPMPCPQALALHPTQALLAASGEGAVTLWRPKQTGWHARLHLLPDGELLVLTPGGEFLATRGATRHAHFVRRSAPSTPILLDDLDLERNRPDRVVAHVGLAAAEDVALYTRARERRVAQLARLTAAGRPEVTLRPPVLVAGTLPGSPAERAGFQAGDVLLALEGATFTDTASAVAALGATTRVRARAMTAGGERPFDLERAEGARFGLALTDWAAPLSVRFERLPVRAVVRSAEPAHLRVALNGGLVAGPAEPLPAGGGERVFSVPLVPGENRVDVWAENAQGDSARARQWVFGVAPASRPTLHGLFVGVSKYRAPENDLAYAAKDARDLAAAFQALAPQYAAVRLETLADADATRERVLAALDGLVARAEAGDEVVVAFAGHGLLLPSLDFVLATHDVDFGAPLGTGLAYEALDARLGALRSRRKLLLLDACHSGEVEGAPVATPPGSAPSEAAAADVAPSTLALAAAPIAEVAAVQTRGLRVARNALSPRQTVVAFEALFADPRRGSGATVIASASGAEFALESDAWRNGVFTYAVIDGLRARRADLDADGRVAVSELKRFVSARVLQLTRGRQTPMARRENVDFDYALVR